MDKRITFRHMEHSNHLENHANTQLAKIEKLLESEKSPISIDLVLEAHKLHGHNKVSFHVITPGFDLVVSDEGPEMQQLVNNVVDTMYRKMREKKKQLRDKRKCCNGYK